MKVRRKTFFRGLVFAMAFAMTILCFPFNVFDAFAYFEDSGDVNYHYLLIGSDPVKEGQGPEKIVSDGVVEDTVTKGDTYKIPFAYVGGQKEKILGRFTDGDKISQASVTVFYNSVALTEGDEVGQVNIYDQGTDGEEKYKANYGEFVAVNEGTYTIRYSYDYKDENGKTYTHSYDLDVRSTLPSATFNFKDNAKFFIPSIIDLKWAHTKDQDGQDTYKDLSLPMPEILDEDGEVVNLLKEGEEETKLQEHYVTSLPVENKGRYVVVSATGGVGGGKIDVVKAEEQVSDQEGNVIHEVGDLYIEGKTFDSPTAGAHDYTIKYSYYEDGQFIASTSKTTKVYPDTKDAKPYYESYKLELQLDSAWNKNDGQTGVEITLPKATGIVKDNDEDKQVDVRYTVKVYYQKDSTSAREEINYDDYKDVLERADDFVESSNETYVLKDPTKFKPLHDGTYNFVYTIYDFYGNKVSSQYGIYYWNKIVDKTAPTPVLFDASEKLDDGKEPVDVTYKFKTRAVPNSVVVYAIGIDDNVNETKDFKAELPEGSKLKRIRRIRNDQETKYDIVDYGDKNLVFNYRTTAETSNAYSLLYTNNYLIQQAKGHEEFHTDEEARQWLAENNYLLVIDNANAEHIYKLFGSKLQEALTDDITGLYDSMTSFSKFLKDASSQEATEQQKTQLETLKTALEKLGFAYLPMNATFGATVNGATTYDDITGMGYGQYYIDYIVSDAAGNETTSTKSIYIGSYTDSEAPTLTFATSLRDTYLPDAKITFTAPTASDNGDSPDTNMRIETYYRYVAQSGEAITDLENDKERISTHTLEQLYKDLDDKKDSVSKGYLTKYADYFDEDHKGQGYVSLTDMSATSYTIDLNEVNDDARTANPATKLQIVTFVYDDSGNISMFAVSANIAKVVDEYAPWLEGASKAITTETETYHVDDEITLPTLIFGDDKVSYLTYNVEVYRYATQTKDGGQAETVKVDVGVYGTESIRDESTMSLVLKPGKFTPGATGQYQARISVVDVNNKVAVCYINYDVVANDESKYDYVKVQTTFSDKTIELDGDETYDPEVGLEIDTPTVDYKIANSISYEEYKKLDGAAQSSAPQKIVKGIDENGAPQDWGTNLTGKNQRFVASKKDVYTLKYYANLVVYDRELFTYAERTFVEGKPTPLAQTGLFYTKGKGASDRTYKIEKAENEGSLLVTTDNVTYELYKKADGKYYVKQGGSGEEQPLERVSAIQSIGSDDEIDAMFKGLKFYTETSQKDYTITVNDNKGPQFSNIYDEVFPEKLSASDVEGGLRFNVPGVQAFDRAGINFQNSRITIRWDMAGHSDSGSQTWYGNKEGDLDKVKNGGEFVINSNGSRNNGTYTFSYHIEDNNQNPTELTKTIEVGDIAGPTVNYSLKSETYTLGSELIIHFSDIHITDDEGGWDDETMEPVITLVNTTSGDDDITGNPLPDGIAFSLDKVGTYELRIEATDSHGNVGSWTQRITITTKSQDPTVTYRVIGTVLIVVSVIVLAGVVIYFIVSKVKLDKELKKK